MIADIGEGLRSFFIQLSRSLGFNLIFTLSIVVELFFVFLFVLKTAYSYEIRLRRSLDKLNNWMFKNKKITQDNIKEFNELVKSGPKRLMYYWQQYILFREKEPSYYLSLDNLVEKPLKTSSVKNNIKYMNIATFLWSAVVLLTSLGSQFNSGTDSLTVNTVIAALALPVLVGFIGLIAAICLNAKQGSNADEIYHIYHIFSRFINNACVDLPPYIDYDLLFTPESIEKGNPQLREYYESRARKAKEEFERAKQSDIEYVAYDFKDAGIDGSLVLERAMKESEAFMNKKTSTLTKIAHVDAQKEALKRNYENVQKDLQRKIQASKENIQKLIQQQEATTNRMEVGFLRKQQEQEIAKQESLQTEYEQEETRYAVSKDELDQEIAQLNKSLEEAKEQVQYAMVSEYQTFYEKILKAAYQNAEVKVAEEKAQLIKERDNNEKELVVVQTQIKRLIDENNVLRTKAGIDLAAQPENAEQTSDTEPETPKGTYDANGNYVYEDGSYHDPNGLFHDVDGKIYDYNGMLISEPEDNKKEEVIPVQESVMPQQPTNMVVDEVTPEELGIEESLEETSTIAQEQESVAKRRGRPKKPVVEKQEEIREPKRRGRPRKEESESTYVSPLREDNAEDAFIPTSSSVRSEKDGFIQSQSPSKKVVRKTSVIKKNNSVKKTNKSAAKEDLDIVSLAKINKLITEEEKKLTKMKALVNSEITDALNASEAKEINAERDEIMKAVAALKNKAEEARSEGKSEAELASINSRLEALIKEIAELNNKNK